MKDKLTFFMDNKILLGVGIGLILGVVFMLGYKSSINLTDAQIEERARNLGMIYQSEQKSIFDKEGENKE